MDIRPTSGLSAEARLAVQRHNLLQLMLHNDASADDLALYIQSARIRRGTINPKDLIIPDKLLLVLPQVRAQVDLIWGEFDRPHPDPEFQARALRRLKPDATLRIVHGAGHWAIYEGADEFNDHLEELLDEPLRRQRSRGTEAG
jgi:pimeloyl-ACP methyl ester carboxylesterase